MNFIRLSLVGLFILFYSVVGFSQSAFDIFTEEVHPLLQARCAKCHGDTQFPLHSVEDSGEAYQDAVKTLNLNFPEQSPLWVRSYNNHCGQEALCGNQEADLLAGVKNWVTQEKKEGNVTDFFKLVSEVTIKVPQKVQANSVPAIESESLFEFDGQDGETYQMKVTRISEAYVYFSDLKIKGTKQYYSYEGVELRSMDIQMQSQNFSNQRVVVKPTEDFVVISRFGSGYVIGLLPEESMQEVTLQFMVKNKLSDLTNAQAKTLFEEGFFLPKEQSILTPHIVSIEGDENNTCALFNNGKIKCWGSNNSGQLGLGHRQAKGDNLGDMGIDLPFISLGTDESVTQVAVGGGHICALFESGRMKCWGENSSGQLGRASTADIGDNPGEMGDNLAFVDFGADDKVVEIALGRNHSCARFDTYKIKCWGENGAGQLGRESTADFGDNEKLTDMNYVNVGTDEKVKQLDAKFNFTCVLLTTNAVKCWGQNSYGQLGNESGATYGNSPGTMGDSLPTLKFGDTAIIRKFELGQHHGCLVFEDEQIKCWGDNYYGQLGLEDAEYRGDNPGEMGENLPYVKISADEKIKKLTVGLNHNCVLTEGGKVKCWGLNNSGQIGVGQNSNIGDADGEMGEGLLETDLGVYEKVSNVQSMGAHSCAIFENGKMKCWGANGSGQLGYSDTQSRGDQPGEMGDPLPFIELGQLLTFD